MGPKGKGKGKGKRGAKKDRDGVGILGKERSAKQGSKQGKRFKITKGQNKRLAKLSKSQRSSGQSFKFKDYANEDRKEAQRSALGIGGTKVPKNKAPTSGKKGGKGDCVGEEDFFASMRRQEAAEAQIKKRKLLGLNPQAQKKKAKKELPPKVPRPASNSKTSSAESATETGGDGGGAAAALAEAGLFPNQRKAAENKSKETKLPEAAHHNPAAHTSKVKMLAGESLHDFNKRLEKAQEQDLNANESRKKMLGAKKREKNQQREKRDKEERRRKDAAKAESRLEKACNEDAGGCSLLGRTREDLRREGPKFGEVAERPLTDTIFDGSVGSKIKGSLDRLKRRSDMKAKGGVAGITEPPSASSFASVKKHSGRNFKFQQLVDNLV